MISYNLVPFLGNSMQSPPSGILLEITSDSHNWNDEQNVAFAATSGKDGCKKDGKGGGGRNKMLSGGGPKSQQSPKQLMVSKYQLKITQLKRKFPLNIRISLLLLF